MVTRPVGCVLYCTHNHSQLESLWQRRLRDLVCSVPGPWRRRVGVGGSKVALLNVSPAPASACSLLRLYREASSGLEAYSELAEETIPRSLFPGMGIRCGLDPLLGVSGSLRRGSERLRRSELGSFRAQPSRLGGPGGRLQAQIGNSGWGLDPREWGTHPSCITRSGGVSIEPRDLALPHSSCCLPVHNKDIVCLSGLHVRL